MIGARALAQPLRARTGVWLVVLLALSLAMAEAQASAAQPSVLSLIVKWTPLLARGFVFNLVISFCAMALGTLAGVLLGMARISLLPALRGSSWLVMQFFRNAPWLVLLCVELV